MKKKLSVSLIDMCLLFSSCAMIAGGGGGSRGGSRIGSNPNPVMQVQADIVGDNIIKNKLAKRSKAKNKREKK